MANFQISIPGALPFCGDTGQPLQVGEFLRVELDVNKFPGVVNRFVDLLVNTITPAQVWDPAQQAIVAGYTYDVTVDDSELPADLTDIDFCDIVSWKCRGCCDQVVDLVSQNVIFYASTAMTITALTNPENGALYQTKGYYNPTDGGGNLYQYEEGSVAPCDGGLILDGKGGDNTQANSNASYPGTGIGRYVAIDQILITSQQFGANLGGAGDAFRRTAMLNSGVGFGELVYDPPLLGDGEGINVSVPTLGAKIGDHVQVSFSVTTQGCFQIGFVEVDDAVTVRFQNETGVSVEMPSGLIETRAFKL